MPLVISRADFDEPALADFLQSHLDGLAPTAPAGSRHALDLSALTRPSVRMWVGHLDGVLVVSGALAALEGDRPAEEVKSMRTAPAARGRGLARAMVGHLMTDARSRGVDRLWLETGSMDFFRPARSLYRSVGFTECAPFGSYVADPNSTFMTLAL